MARSYAPLLTSIWSDDDFVALSPPVQRAYLLLISQPNITYCGVLAYTPKRWARMSAGTTPENIVGAIHELELARFVVVDHETEELLVRSFVRHNGVYGQPQLTKAMVKSYADILSPRLRDAFLVALPEPLPQAAETLAEPRAEAERRVSQAPGHDPDLNLDPDLNSSSSDVTSAARPNKDDDEVLSELAELRLEARMAVDTLKPIGDRVGWLQATKERDRTTLNGHVGEARARFPDASAKELARFLFDGTKPPQARVFFCGKCLENHAGACDPANEIEVSPS